MIPNVILIPADEARDFIDSVMDLDEFMVRLRHHYYANREMWQAEPDEVEQTAPKVAPKVPVKPKPRIAPPRAPRKTATHAAPDPEFSAWLQTTFQERFPDIVLDEGAIQTVSDSGYDMDVVEDAIFLTYARHVTKGVGSPPGLFLWFLRETGASKIKSQAEQARKQLARSHDSIIKEMRLATEAKVRENPDLLKRASTILDRLDGEPSDG